MLSKYLKPDFQARTADRARVLTASLRVLKRIPLPRSRATLHKGYGETDNRQDVQSNAECHDRSPEPTLRSEKADE